MKIKMLVSMAGNGFALSVGEDTERFSATEASRIVAAGYAIPVAAPVVERAIASPTQERRNNRKKGSE